MFPQSSLAVICLYYWPQIEQKSSLVDEHFVFLPFFQLINFELA